MSTEETPISLKNKSKIFQFKNNIELLKQLELLDSENFQLKEALSELEKDLKDKDQSIEESQKIITKLKEEYTKVIKELQQMEKSYNELLDEMNQKSQEIKIAKKNQSLLDVLQKNNDFLFNEKNNLHKENIIMKKKIMSCGNVSSKNEKDLKNKDLMIENLQKKNNSYIKMLKEREIIIEEQNNKIKDLNDIINNKNEELKIVMNISKEINKENKTNVQELAKQAINTIKTFQSNISNKNRNHSVDYNSKISLRNSKQIFGDFESIFKNNKATFLLEDAINGVMFIPNNLKSISKEFLLNMNLKTELIKNELFSGLLRESHFVNFLQKIFGNIYKKDSNEVIPFFQKIIEFKKKYLNVIKENYKLKKILLNINNKHFSDIQKIKDNVFNNHKKMKYVFAKKKLEIQKLKNELKSLNNIIINNNIQNNNSSIKTLKHISSNDCNNRIKSFGEFMTPKIWNTLPSWEITDFSETKIDNTSREMNYRDSYVRSSKITDEKKSKGKKSYNKLIKYNSIVNHNKSLEFHKQINTDINKSQNLMYFENKNNSKNLKNVKMNNNYSYKKDIYNLQNEFNNILYKSVTQNRNILSLNDNKNETPKIKPIFIKKDKYSNNKQKKEKDIKENIFSERTKEKKLNIPHFSSNNINLQRSQILKRNGKDIFNLNKNLSVTENNNYNNFNNEKKKNRNTIFNVDFFIDLFLKLNNNVFDIFELTDYKKKYDLTSIDRIYLSFKKICNELKNKTDEINLKINKSHNLTNNNFKENMKNERKQFMDNSFKIFNERIICLKKLEIEFINMNEYIKNYLVSLEITIKIMYNKGKKYLKFEPIEKLFNLFEDCLSYRIDEMNENIVFNRKLLIKLFKNHINCLFLSFEYKFN